MPQYRQVYTMAQSIRRVENRQYVPYQGLKMFVQNGHVMQATRVRNEQAAVTATALHGMHVLPPLSKGEVRVLEFLYSTGAGVPTIRKQALAFGLGLDAAGQLEDANIWSPSKLTEGNICTFSNRLKV